MTNVIQMPRKLGLTTVEAAAYLGLARKSLFNLIQAEQGPRHIKRGNRLYFQTRDLDAWDKQRTTIREAYSK